MQHKNDIWKLKVGYLQGIENVDIYDIMIYWYCTE